MTHDHYPEWLVELAGEINECVRKYDALEDVREIVRQWYEEFKAAEKAQLDWRQRRDAHGKRIESEAKLRQAEPVPDEAENATEQWIFFRAFGYERDGEQKFIDGWVPIELLHEPVWKGPLPLSERPLTLVEEYTITAAVHDVVFPSDPINPWHDAPPWWEQKYRTRMPEFDYANVVSNVRTLPDFEKVAIRAIIGAVLDDLRKRSESAQTKDKSQASVNAATDRVDKATLATAILFQEPAISPTELAKRVGVARSTLYSNSPKWKVVRQTLIARYQCSVPRGRKRNDEPIDAEGECREWHPTDDNND